ncbi:hypothetical protein LMG26411_03879 [Cupriavidus numazuensis]|uniref:Uncharacterized protein n=1 Tax=Cupriavidus numazuensis TaxID=221992 RepID=A0ABN7Q086_9BURK|nr:hypothetical protein LMG26411_03879 [Cupriavidus numazuensis]
MAPRWASSIRTPTDSSPDRQPAYRAGGIPYHGSPAILVIVGPAAMESIMNLRDSILLVGGWLLVCVTSGSMITFAAQVLPG